MITFFDQGICKTRSEHMREIVSMASVFGIRFRLSGNTSGNYIAKSYNGTYCKWNIFKNECKFLNKHQLFFLLVKITSIGLKLNRPCCIIG